MTAPQAPSAVTRGDVCLSSTDVLHDLHQRALDDTTAAVIRQELFDAWLQDQLWEMRIDLTGERREGRCPFCLAPLALLALCRLPRP
jgi:hypothetical protein